ncbi:MAG: hypothetical protein COT84_02165 [Chlamydiae bacterium CG10_big_fil_rev_8_21_14_0_10_35_9]|nr:MAG: hypothetical protein COT84_02165 [Chlamydiae bacterium CG10_big_fil_rev_8_21_14_0_10_35_9]
MFEELPALSSLSFFQMSALCYHVPLSDNLVTSKKYLLPSTSKYLDEESFARIYMGFNELKILLHIEVDVPFQEASLSDFRKTDSIELFFDTRDLKEKDIITQFHHHFVFFPEKIEGTLGREITRFRTDDMHMLCEPQSLVATPFYGKKNYILDIEIPLSALHGYDPTAFKRLGFCYRINRKDADPQHFGISSFEYAIEKHPSLWPSLSLINLI